MIIGAFLAYALVTGIAYWLVGLLLARLGAPGWLFTILTGATLVYVFWLLSTSGPVILGR